MNAATNEDFTMANDKRQDRYFAPGTRVRSDAFVDGDDDNVRSEYGVVVHCWPDDEIGMWDCYIAFFGDSLPEGKPADAPYVLRYAAATLVEVTE